MQQRLLNYLGDAEPVMIVTAFGLAYGTVRLTPAVPPMAAQVVGQGPGMHQSASMLSLVLVTMRSLNQSSNAPRW